jgi:SAM-dependent methyltransferase
MNRSQAPARKDSKAGGRQTCGVCVLCGASAASHWRREGDWSVYRCDGCGLLRTWPLPEAAYLARAYEDPEYHKQRSVLERQAWDQRGAEILALFPHRPKRLLDFGAGQGDLVRTMRSAGIEAEGVEPSELARATARSVHGLELWESLGTGPEIDGGFDTITAIHSLEHVPDPLATLRELRRALMPVGHLLIEVPHAGSFDMRFPTRRRVLLDLPLHLHHFTPEILGRLAEEAGFEVVDVMLFNSWPVERAISLRRPRDSKVAADTAPGSGGPSRRFAWRRRIVPGLRRTFPGGKFQLLARNPG